MLYRRSVLLFLVIWAATFDSFSQESGPPRTRTVQRDPQALTILTQVLNAAGGGTALAAIHDMTATGTITYYWAGEEVQGTVTVKGRGTGQFRLDASLPDGVRSWGVNNGTGFVKEQDGSKNQIPYHNTVNFGSLTFPFAYILAAPRDNSTSITYVGLETKDGRQIHHIRMRKIFPSDDDPGDILSKLSTRDFFIDPVTFQVVSTLDMVHPLNASTIDYPHEMLFSDYRPANGFLVPFSITEVATGQRTYTIQLNQVTFNGALKDSDFDQ